MAINICSLHHLFGDILNAVAIVVSKKGKRVGKHNTEPRLNEPPFNEVLDITNDTLCLSQNYHKMYGIEPWYNEFLDIANIIRKAKHKIYLDITNYNVNMQQKINAEEINSQQIL